jgi:two-component system alkaline phosphatase synthesis response regulator PhoP
MRTLALIVCSVAGLAMLFGVARAAEPDAGALSVERGRGSVMLDLRGSILGRLSSGTLRVTDLTPADRYAPLVFGRKVTQERINARTSVYRGQGLRFRMLGGGYRAVVRGNGIDLSAVGKGSAVLRGDPRFFGDDVGVYSLEGVDCELEPESCLPLPLQAERFTLGAAVTSSHSILVVEDEASIATFVAAYLRNAGYTVKTAASAQSALIELAGDSPALIVLDLNLPDGDGVELCRRIRKTSDVPILMLTARDEDIDKIIGLEVGADDYMTKPFNPRELVARVKSVLRRAAPERRKSEADEIQHGELAVNAGKREVYVGDEEIRLAPKEFDLLWELLDHRGIVLTRDQLLERVWGYTFAGDTRTVDVHVRQIRRKLGDASPIVTVWGVGYKVASERTPAPTA